MADRTVSVRLQAITAQYDAAMARSGVHTKSLGMQVEQLGTRGASAINSLTNGLVDLSGKGALVAGGLAVGGAALFKFLSDGVAGYTQLVSEVDAYQDVTGAAADESSRMVAIAQAFGVSADTLARSMFRLAKNVEENADVLARYGVEIARTADGSIDLNTTLLNVADAYKEVGGGQAGALLAQEAFGRGGRALIDVLERERSELEAVTAAAEEHGQIVSDQDIANVVEYQVATRELSAAWAEFSRTAGADAVPVLTDVFQGLVDAKDGVDAVLGAVPRLGEALRGMLEDFNPLDPVLDLLRGDFKDAAVGILPFGNMLHDLAFGADDASSSAELLAAAVDFLGRTAGDGAGATGDLADEVVTLDDALAELLGTAFGVEDALDNVEQSIVDMMTKVAVARDEVGAAATSLDDTTEAGLANREMWRSLVGDVAAAASAMSANGSTSGEVAAMVDLQRTRLVALAGQLGFNQAAVGRYIDVLLQVPGAVQGASGGTIDVNTAPAESKVHGLIGLLNGVLGAVARVNQALRVTQYGSAATDRIPAFQMPSLSPVSLSLPAPAPVRSSAGGGGGGGGGPAAQTPEEARREWLRADDEFRRNQFEHNMLSLEQYQDYLSQRMAMEQEGSAEWFRLLEEQERVRDEHLADVRAWNDALAENERDAIEDRRRAREEMRRIREEQAREEERRADEVARARDEAASKLERLLDQERSIRERIEDTTEAHYERLRQLDDRYDADVEATLSGRRDDLIRWADVAERVQVRWGNSVDALARNTRDQVAVFDEWADALQEARDRGVSEDVIGLLGLDEGPEALGQLRMFTLATQDEIDDLNAAVEQRTAQAGDRVAAEQEDSFSKIGQTLVGLADRYTQEIEALEADFLARQEELGEDLAQLGYDHGKAYGDLLAEGLRSTIPGIRAAAQELLDATKPPEKWTPFPGSQNPLTKPILGPKVPGVSTLHVDVWVGDKPVKDAVTSVLKDKSTGTKIATGV